MGERWQDDNKNTFCMFWGGHWGQRGTSPQNVVFLETPWQYNFESAHFLGSDFCRTFFFFFFRGFLFIGRIFSQILSPDFFFSFLWEKVPRKILYEIPAKSPKIHTTKIPDTFLQRVWANILLSRNFIVIAQAFHGAGATKLGFCLAVADHASVSVLGLRQSGELPCHTDHHHHSTPEPGRCDLNLT